MVDAGEFAEAVHEFLGAAHGAGEGAADADVVFAWGGLAEAGVEGDDFEDFDGFEAEFGGDPVDGFVGDESVAVLDGVEEGEDGGSLFFIGVLGDALGGLFFEVFGG